MQIELTLHGQRYRADVSVPIDVTRGIVPGHAGIAFHLGGAREEPVRAGGFVGSVAEGGSVNCQSLDVRVHGNGTHIECVGHILAERVVIADVLPPPLIVGWLAHVPATPLHASHDQVIGQSDGADLVVTESALRQAFAPCLARGLAPGAAVLRVSGPWPDFSGQNAPYFTDNAIAYLCALGIVHLLVDLPSLDREHDGGTVPAHRRFWGIAAGQRDLAGQPPSPRTVTELLAIPPDASEGLYLVNLQVPVLHSDAAPARVLLFPLHEAPLP